MRTDEELLGSSDPEDFGWFFDRHEPALRDWFGARVHDPDDTPELVAETFAAAVAGRPRATAPAAGWLRGLAERELAAYRRRGDAETRMRRRLRIAPPPAALRDELVDAAGRPPPRALPRGRTIAVVAAGGALAVILVLAFTGGRREEPAAPARATAAPGGDRQLFGGSLEPGVRYRARAFVPALSFVVPDTEWYVDQAIDPDSLLLSRRDRVRGQPGSERPATQFLGFGRLTEVYDPATPGRTASLTPAPADLRGWLARHPDVRVGGARAATIAGVPGIRFGVEVRFDRPAHQDPDCARFSLEGCAAIAPGLSFFDGTVMQLTVLRTEPDPLIVSEIAARRRGLAELEAAAAPVLRSLRIGVR